MSAKGVFQVFSIDLSDPLDLEPVSVAGRPRLVVARGDADAELRIDSPGVEPLPGDTGQELCADGGIDTVYVTHPGGGGTLYLVAVKGGSTYSADRGGEGGGGASYEPARLGGALASGNTISDGEEASEQVDISDVDRLRVRAQVSGIASFQAVDAVARGGAVHLASYETPAGEPRVVTVDGGDQTLEVFDASDPDSLVSLGTFNDATLGTSYAAVGIDPAQELALVVVSDAGNSDSILAVIDISDPTAITLQGQVTYEGANGTGGTPHRLPVVDPDRDFVVIGNSNTFDLYLVSYSTPAAPTLEDTLAGTYVSGRAIDVNRGFVLQPNPALSASGTTRVEVLDYKSGAFTVRNQTDFSAIGNDPMHSAWDDARQYLYAIGESGEIEVYDYANVDQPSLVVAQNPGITNFNISNGTGLAVDPSQDLLWIKYQNTGSWRANVALIDLAQLPTVTLLLDAFEVEGAAVNLGGRWGATYLSTIERVYWLEDEDDVVGTLRPSLGQDELRVFFLDPTGTRVEAGNPTAVTLEDGREGEMTVDVVGEYAADVEISNRSGQQATIGHVDVYRKEI